MVSPQTAHIDNRYSFLIRGIDNAHLVVVYWLLLTSTFCNTGWAVS